MNMSRKDRDPADVLTAYALKEYERLQQESPPLSGDSIAEFKKDFQMENKLFLMLLKINLLFM